MNTVNIGTQLAYVPALPKQHNFLFPFCLRTKHTIQAASQPFCHQFTAAAAVVWNNTMMILPILFYFVYVMLCFCCVFFLFLGSGEQSSTGVRGVQLFSCHVSHPPASVGGVT